MSAFCTKLILEDDGGFPMALVTPFVYASDRLHRLILVPAGFRTDLASIPRVLWNVLPPVSKADHAAVIHDFLYQTGGVTRADADAVLNEAMEVAGVARVQRWLIYAGVRVGGWKVWNAYRAAAPAVA